MDEAQKRLWSGFAINHCTPEWRGTREAIASASDARRISIDVAPERLWSGFAINHCSPPWRGTREALSRFCYQQVHQMLGGPARM